MTKELKGFHVLMIAIGAFAVIVTANLTMLFAATGSFPGLVVQNSYVAGQGWNDRTARQDALGWEQAVSYDAADIIIALRADDGAPITAEHVAVTIGRPATNAEDQTFALSGTAPFRIPVDLAPGQWRIKLTIDGAQPYQKTSALLVSEAL